MHILQTREGEYTAYYHQHHATGYTHEQAIVNLLTLILY